MNLNNLLINNIEYIYLYWCTKQAKLDGHSNQNLSPIDFHEHLS